MGSGYRLLTRRTLAVLVAVPLVVMSPAVTSAAAPRNGPPPVQRVPKLQHRNLTPAHGTRVATPPSAPRLGTRWPSARSSELTLNAQSQRAGSVPLLVSSMGPVSQNARLRVGVQSQRVSRRAHVNGVIYSLTRLDPSSGGLRVNIDYSAYANAAGAGYGYRLHLMQLPACVLISPQVPACQQQTPVQATNDGTAMLLSTTVNPAGQVASTPGPKTKLNGPLMGSAAGSTLVVAATSDPTGSNGTFTATSLAPSGSWSASGASGDFTWSYPITTPPVAAGADVAPKVALSYDSGVVDGRISATNNQSSWVGEGWDYTPGYIERTYRTCADDTTLPVAEQTGDLCWAGQLLTFSLGSRSGPIVLDDSTKTFHLSGDDGSQVQLVGAGTGGYQGEYWEITSPSGVQYYFGLNNLPGRSTQTQTDSTWTVPVYGAHSSDPCYNSSFSSAGCTQAWRWNLDYIVDPNGNATAYYYTPETNSYTADYNPTYGANGTLVSYDRGGYLTEIDYGLRQEGGSVYAVHASGQVAFHLAYRCTSSGSNCDPANLTNSSYWPYWPDVPGDLDCASSGTCSTYSPTFWTIEQVTTIATAFWTGTAWQTVDSYALGQSFPTSGDPELELNSITRTAYPTTGMSSIVMPPVSFGYTLMDNRVAGINNEPAMQHWRISTIDAETGADLTVLYSCPTSTGWGDCQNNNQAQPLCTATSLPTNPAQDTAECFPVYWTPAYNTTPILDWFHKYVVTQVNRTDINSLVTSAPERITTYTYVGTPAWHYDDNPVVVPANRTYGQFRGYSLVQTRTGNVANTSNGVADQQTLTTATYFRGMNGDTLAHTDNVTVTSASNTFTDSAASSADVGAAVYAAGIPSGTTVTSVNTTTAVVTLNQAATATATEHVAFVQTATRNAKVSDSVGDNYTDSDQYADVPLETQTFNYDGGSEISATITVPETVATTASQALTGLPDLVATIVRTQSTRQLTNLAAGGTTTHKTVDTYDSVGRLTSESDTGTGLGAACTTNSYASNTTAFITDRVKETIRYASACPPGSGATVLSDVRHCYDNLALGSVGSTGNETETDTATTSSHFARVTTAYDTSGRPTSVTAYLSATDTTGRTTTTTYTPADGGPLTKVVTTNALQQTTTNIVDPARGVTTESVNVAGLVTVAAYDALGRLTGVWDPGQVQGTNPATTTYSYLFGPSAPLAVTKQTLVDPGNGATPGYITTISIYDAFGQLRQTQTDGIGSNGNPNGRMVTDTYTDSHGWLIATNNHWYTDGAPSTTIVQTALSGITDRTQASYDGAGRPTLSAEYDPNASTATPTWETQTVYSGNSTTVIPDICPTGSPAAQCASNPGPTQSDGGVETSIFTDPRGETTAVDQWSSPPTISGGVLSGGTADKTTYAYDPIGHKTAMTTAAGTTLKATSTWTYDLAGRVTNQSDPDTGATTNSYDDLGELISTTDNKAQTLAYSYDALGRKTGEYLNTTSGTQLAGWVYDTLQAGQLTSDTRYTPNGNYTVAATGYDSAGNPAGTATTIPSNLSGLGGTYTTKYSWTTTHLLAGTTPAAAGYLPNEKVADWYDSFGDPTGLTGYSTYVSAATYTPDGQPNQYTVGVNDQTAWLTYTYDAQTEQVTGDLFSSKTPIPQVENTTYSYDASGNITQAADTQGGGNTPPVETNCYTYNTLDQLAQAWSATDNCAANPTTNGDSTVGGPQPYWDTWQYDTAGDRTNQTQHSLTTGVADTVTTYTNGTTTGQAHALAATATTGPNPANASYSYDADGNLQAATLPAGGNTYSWDQENHLTSATTPTGTTSYIYDANGNTLVRTDTAGSTTTTIVYLPGEELTRTSNGSTATVSGTRFYSIGSTVIAERTDWYAVDDLYSNLQGTTQTALPTNNNGFGTAIRRYLDPYGNPIAATTGGTWPDNHAFLDKPTDTTTGLDQLGARQYDPATGRFITVDPLVNQTHDPYTYANDNPITNTDPSGLHLEGTGGCDNPAGCGSGGGGAGSGTKSNGGGDGYGPTPPPTGTQGSSGSGGGSGGGSSCYAYCGIPSQSTLNSLCNRACQASAPQLSSNLEYSNVGLGVGYGENNWTSPWDAADLVLTVGTTLGLATCALPFDGVCEADAAGESALIKEDISTVSTDDAGGAETEGALADQSAVTARLQAHVDSAVSDYESGAIGMSPAQARAAAANPGLEAAFRGSVIDNAAKARVLADPGLDVYATPNFTYGADFFDAYGNWWDMTTEAQWQAHVDQYSGLYGTSGIRLSTSP